MSRFLRFSVCLSLFSIFAGPAFGGNYFGNLYQTEKRGVINTVSGFAELPIALHDAHGEGATPAGFVEAAFSGTRGAIMRTASGIWDIPAGVVPGFQKGFPLEPETLLKR